MEHIEVDINTGETKTIVLSPEDEARVRAAAASSVVVVEQSGVVTLTDILAHMKELSAKIDNISGVQVASVSAAPIAGGARKIA